MEEEKWVEIADGYFISNTGRLKTWKCQNGRTIGKKYERISKPMLKKNGYLEYYVGNRKFASAHRLVALAFLKREKHHTQVNHKDFDRTNNHVDNLEWVTREENNRHRYENGRANQWTLYGQRNKPENI